VPLARVPCLWISCVPGYRSAFFGVFLPRIIDLLSSFSVWLLQLHPSSFRVLMCGSLVFRFGCNASTLMPSASFVISGPFLFLLREFFSSSETAFCSPRIPRKCEPCVRGDFVMFHTLCRGNQRRVRTSSSKSSSMIPCLRNQSLHALALLAFCLFTHLIQHLFQTPHMFFCLLQVSQIQTVTPPKWRPSPFPEVPHN